MIDLDELFCAAALVLVLLYCIAYPNVLVVWN